MAERSGDKVRCKVSLVVVLIDDFTNKLILGSGVKAWIEGEKPAIRKTEGYHVFTDLQSTEVELLIEGPLYERQAVFVDLNQTKDSYTLLKIRMIPNRSYPIPRNTTCVEGKAEPGSIIHILCRENIKPLKLLYDYESGIEDGQEISIFHPEDMEIEGKVLYIENKDKSKKEFFRIQKRQDNSNRYLLSKKLLGDYKKIGTAIYPVYSSKADANGEFFIPISNMNKEVHSFFCQADGSEITCREREFRTGVLNLLDFTEEES